MAENVLDFEKLLAPIPGDNPAGVNLREGTSAYSVYDEIKDKRLELRAKERKDEQTDWRPLLELGKTTIAEKSKDIDVASYMLEAVIRRHGFHGLRDGLRLLRELVESYWDHLYPRPDEEEGQPVRIRTLDGVMRNMHVQVGRVPLTESNTAGEDTFTLRDYERASGTDQGQHVAEQDRTTEDVIKRAEAESSADFYAELKEAITASVSEQERLFALLAEKCGTDDMGLPYACAPPAFREALASVLRIVEPIAARKMPMEKDPKTEETLTDEASAESKGPAMLSASVKSRNEAFDTLLQVARYFRETEPQSPISYALERIVRWGRMPLPELWSELIEEDKSRSTVFKLVGIPPPEPLEC